MLQGWYHWVGKTGWAQRTDTDSREQHTGDKEWKHLFGA